MKFDPTNIIEEYQMSDVVVSKVKALVRAYRELEIVSTIGKPEAHFYTNISGWICEGYADLDCGGYGEEYKTTGRPEMYLDRSHVEWQAGMYFLGFPEWEWVDFKVVRTPGQKFRGGRKLKEETPDDYTNRIHTDIMSRPAYYFQNWDKNKKTFGQRFWRTEFNLLDLERRISNIVNQMRYIINTNSWYPNVLACLVPVKCEYYDIRQSDVISGKLYEQITVEEGKEGLR